MADVSKYKNRVKELHRQGKTAFGVHVKVPAPALVEVAAHAGSDFVKFDQYHFPFTPDMLYHLMLAANAHDLTPWVRCRNDPYEIMTMLDLGAQALSIPNVDTADQAKAAVAATRYFPDGVREANRPTRLRHLSNEDYHALVKTEILLSVAIEGKEGMDNYKEIVKVDGVDVIATGRADMALALGVKNPDDPVVIAAQERVLMAALDAGKQVTMTYHDTPHGIEEAHKWMERGVRVVTLEGDRNILMRVWKDAFKQLKPHAK